MEVNDASNMKQVIMDSPGQLAAGLTLAKGVSVQGNFNKVIICAMGGSALPAELIKTSLPAAVPVYIHRDYNLPPIADSQSLVICISYSGNTEETLSALEQAIAQKLAIICMSSGGQMEKLGSENNLPIVKIPSGIQPRSAIGYMFSALAEILARQNIVPDASAELQSIIPLLEEAGATLEKNGKELAKKLAGKIPIVYSSCEFKTVAQIWKIKFNENAKIPAFYNYFPELNHNEMAGFSNLAKGNPFHFIILKDANDHPRTQRRMELFAALLAKKGAPTDFVAMQGDSRLLKTFWTLLLGDWTSYYLALEQGIDPSPVDMVEEFKKLLAE